MAAMSALICDSLPGWCYSKRWRIVLVLALWSAEPVTTQDACGRLEHALSVNQTECFTIWQLLECIDGGQQFNVTTQWAADPAVGLAEILQNPNTWTTFFAAPDDFYDGNQSSPAKDFRTTGNATASQAQTARLTFLYMSLTGAYDGTGLLTWTNEDSAIPTVLDRTYRAEGYATAAFAQLEFKDSTGGNASDIMDISVSEYSTYLVGKPYYGPAQLLGQYPACNGFLQVVSQYWTLEPSTVHPTVQAIAQRTGNRFPEAAAAPLSENPFLAYEPDCFVEDTSYGGTDALVQLNRVAALNSSSPAALWSLLSRFLPWGTSYDGQSDTAQAMAGLSGFPTLQSMSFTLFLPENDRGQLDLSFVNETEAVAFFLNSLLFGAYCPQELLDVGLTYNSLYYVTSAQTGLLFDNNTQTGLGLKQLSDVQSSLNNGEQSGTISGLSSILRHAVICKSVIYYYRSSSGLRPPPLSPDTAARLPAASGVWDTVQQGSSVFQATPGACAAPDNKLPSFDTLSLPTNVLPSPPAPSSPRSPAAAPGTTPPTTSVKAGALSIGAIIGIAVGASLLLLAALGLLLHFRRKSKRQRAAAPSASQQAPFKESEGVSDSVIKSSDSEVYPFHTVAVKFPGARSSQTSRGVLSSQAISSVWSEELRQVLVTADSNWAISWDDVQEIRKIGSGSFGDVSLGMWHGKEVAIKKLQLKDAFSPETQQCAMNVMMEALKKEVGILAGLKHPNVLLFMGVMLSDDSAVPPAILTEYCENGSLFSVLAAAAGRSTSLPKLHLSWRTRVNMALDIALGMGFLHARNILHADLKSPNILVDRGWNVKVSDFGMSKVLDQGKSKTSVADLNPRWLDPQRIEMGVHSKAADVYSHGIIMWELLTSNVPFADLPAYTISFAVVNKALRPPVPSIEGLQNQLDSISGVERYVALMQRCWAQNPDDRPTFEDVIPELRAILAAMPLQS